eukprot:Em0012g646a
MVSAVTVSGCTNASVVFGWIVATLLHHTRDRKVERKFLDASGVPTLKWKRGEWNSGSIICRPPLLELPAFGTLNTPAHLVCLMKKCMPAKYSGTAGYLSKFVEPKVDIPGGVEHSGWSVSALGSWCCSSPVQNQIQECT